MSDPTTDPFLDFESELQSLLQLTAQVQQRLEQHGDAVDALGAVRTALQQALGSLESGAEAMKQAAAKLEPISTARVVEKMEEAAERIRGVGETVGEAAERRLDGLAEQVGAEVKHVAASWEEASMAVGARLEKAEAAVVAANASLGESADGLRRATEEMADRWASVERAIREAGTADERRAADQTERLDRLAQESAASRTASDERFASVGDRLEDLGRQSERSHEATAERLVEFDGRLLEVRDGTTRCARDASRLLEQLEAMRTVVDTAARRGLVSMVLAGLAALAAGVSGVLLVLGAGGSVGG